MTAVRSSSLTSASFQCSPRKKRQEWASKSPCSRAISRLRERPVLICVAPTGSSKAITVALFPPPLVDSLVKSGPRKRPGLIQGRQLTSPPPDLEITTTAEIRMDRKVDRRRHGATQPTQPSNGIIATYPCAEVVICRCSIRLMSPKSSRVWKSQIWGNKVSRIVSQFNFYTLVMSRAHPSAAIPSVLLHIDAFRWTVCPTPPSPRMSLMIQLGELLFLSWPAAFVRVGVFTHHSCGLFNITTTGIATTLVLRPTRILFFTILDQRLMT